MLIMGRELSETGVRCEKSYWKSSQPVKIWQNNIVVVTKIVFVGHPTKKYSTYPNLSQLFRHFHGFIKGSPCPHRTAPRDPWHLGYNANRSKSVSRSSPHSDGQADQTWWHWWNQNCWFFGFKKSCLCGTTFKITRSLYLFWIN